MSNVSPEPPNSAMHPTRWLGRPLGSRATRAGDCNVVQARSQTSPLTPEIGQEPISRSRRNADGC